MDIKTLKKEYQKRKTEIKQRLKDFKKSKDHFYELCFCLLTPQSKAFKCDACIKVLQEKDFKNNEFELNNILKKYTRFHNNKSNYLVRFKDSHAKILGDLEKIKSPVEKRDYLVENIKGLGLKEASHFLRNRGYENLAILDRHILNHLNGLNLIKLPKSLSKNKYLEIEKIFQDFSKKISIPMDELDLLFWSLQTGQVFK